MVIFALLVIALRLLVQIGIQVIYWQRPAWEHFLNTIYVYYALNVITVILILVGMVHFL